jgi:hypothetical protein
MIVLSCNRIFIEQTIVMEVDVNFVCFMVFQCCQRLKLLVKIMDEAISFKRFCFPFSSSVIYIVIFCVLLQICAM